MDKKNNTQTDQKAELLKLKQTAMCGTVRYIENPQKIHRKKIHKQIRKRSYSN